MTEMFGEAWLPMSVPDLAPDDDDDDGCKVRSATNYSYICAETFDLDELQIFE